VRLTLSPSTWKLIEAVKTWRTPVDEKERYDRARKRVEEIKGFYVHLIVYIFVNLGLFLLNILSSRETLWFYWPLLGWGVGLVAHGISVFGLRGVFGPTWEERKIREIMEKERERESRP
jgi:hypothetical protein